MCGQIIFEVHVNDRLASIVLVVVECPCTVAESAYFAGIRARDWSG